MNPKNNTLTLGSEDELDEPYVQTVSTKEFMETVERESQNENDDLPASHPDPPSDPITRSSMH